MSDKKDIAVSGAAAVLLIAFMLLVGISGVLFTSWILMLVLGALGIQLGFTGPGFFTVFLVVWVLSIIAHIFRS